MVGDNVRKKIIGVSVVFVVLAMLCIQPVYAAKEVKVYAWTDKPWYNPGDCGKLKISVLNGLEVPVEIHNITITYPWYTYDADKDEYVGNKTIRGKPIYNMARSGSETDHYYTEVEFTVPNDGRAVRKPINVTVGTSDGTKYAHPSISVNSPVMPVLMVGLDTWMTSLGVLIVVCTIILAAVIFLSTRRARVPRIVAPPVSKTKAE